MHVFYTPDIASAIYTLNEEESRHCSKVLRLVVGNIVQLIDGKGTLYEAEIIEVGKRNVNLKVISKIDDYNKRNHHLHIAIAPTKNNDRLEWFLEKATEIGIDEITPIICDRSERRVVKQDRLEKVITSAVKQSLTAYHPKINEAISFSNFIATQDNSQKFIAHCLAGEKPFIKQLLKQHEPCIVLIGPEGDFTENEIEQALQKEYNAVTLGKTRLRTETAALAACFEVNYINR